MSSDTRFRGNIAAEDVIINTTKLEVVRMMNDRSYISKSFGSGKSEMIFVADRSTLFSKGYLNLYDQLTGRSITGNIVRMTLG